ncbi:hypothetical protein DC439_07820 [Agrobacterium tumefaciens]|nr:hypothetical protein DC439_07820 [Agrobacterium tumefaciens]
MCDWRRRNGGDGPISAASPYLIPVLVTGIKPAQVLGLEGLLPLHESRVGRFPVTSTGMREGEAGGLAKQNRPEGPGG